MATATIKKRAGDWFAETESVTLVLTAEEAASLYILCGSTSSVISNGPGMNISCLYVELSNAGMPKRNSRVIRQEAIFQDSHIKEFFK